MPFSVSENHRGGREFSIMEPVTVQQGIHSILKGSKVTSAGEKWLTAALDPFHDTTLAHEGYPDTATGDSVVLTLQRAFTVTKPASAAGQWDALIAFMPISSGSNQGSDTDCDGGAAFFSDANICHYQSTPPLTGFATDVLIHTADTGQELYPISATGFVAADWAPTNFESKRIQLLHEDNPSAFCRMIAAGIEVKNTTAEIYKQGSVVVGRLPGCVQRGINRMIDDDSVVTNPNNNEVITCMAPPGLVDYARRVPNSKDWLAADGVYGVMTMKSVEHPPTIPESGVAFASSNGTQNLTTGASPGVGVLVTPSVYNARPAGNKCQPNNFNGWFAFFSGLSNETSLLVTGKSLVEIFPGVQSARIQEASPSPANDPRALRIYSALASNLPVGVPVSMNPKGEWWRMVLRGVRAVLPVVEPALGPMAPLVHMGARYIDNLTKPAVAPPNQTQTPRRKQKQRKPITDQQRAMLQSAQRIINRANSGTYVRPARLANAKATVERISTRYA